MKRTWIITITILLLVGIAVTVQFLKKSETREKTTISKTTVVAYWTCPMHPQIHSEHPGECPICHMKLVQVKTNPDGNKADPGESRTTIQATKDQLALTGTEKAEVEKMNLKVKIPVSGRFISSSSVAFQIYESDLRYVKPGLSFKGASSFYPEDELNGTITTVDSIVDPTSRTVRVVGSVKNGGRSVPSETGFRGDIEFTLKDRIAVAESSVLHTGSGDLVYVFTSENRLTPRRVKLGLKSEGFFDVVEGVEIGESISTGPNFLIDSESKIRAISMPEDGAPNKSKPSCPKGQHWEIPMSMCMPGEGS